MARGWREGVACQELGRHALRQAGKGQDVRGLESGYAFFELTPVSGCQRASNGFPWLPCKFYKPGGLKCRLVALQFWE